ncbi:uncharacterized protein LOC111370823 [Olea europaea var. sylvestris]|uniref:uncharacterized protein LOC111370823 n=1 Tax=Olea europaea var. sylvestris TaxID=158386 RepID=UPI000C1D70D0|nr:uncharacterized protein LOC111370823 [Olea europaea var. sylvestris]
MAALYRQKGMVHYLYNKTPKDVSSPEKGANGVTLLNYLITVEIYDVVLLLLEKYPQLGVIPDVNDNYAIKLFAQRPSAFLSGTELSFWEKLIYFSLELVHKLGWGILRSIGKEKCLMGMRYDIFGNNYLHLAAKLSLPSRLDIVTGAALQMQRELQWFKEVGSTVQRKLKEELNSHNKTPKILFTDEHEKLAKKAEDWMKRTAGSSMIVATLIATIMFRTAFTVPRGNKNDTGMPTILETQRIPFLIFMILNALSMFSSSTSLLIFLGIFTARYAEDDFLKSLPTKLISGLTNLFLSIVTMMASFGTGLYLILHENWSWVTVLIIVLTMIPIVLFSIFQFPLLIEMTQRTYGAGILDEYKKKSCFAKFRACLIRRNPLRKKRH